MGILSIIQGFRGVCFNILKASKKHPFVTPGYDFLGDNTSGNKLFGPKKVNRNSQTERTWSERPLLPSAEEPVILFSFWAHPTLLNRLCFKSL